MSLEFQTWICPTCGDDHSWPERICKALRRANRIEEAALSLYINARPLVVEVLLMPSSSAMVRTNLAAWVRLRDFTLPEMAACLEAEE